MYLIFELNADSVCFSFYRVFHFIFIRTVLFVYICGLNILNCFNSTLVSFSLKHAQLPNDYIASALILLRSTLSALVKS